MGDTALFVSGFFADSLSRGLVDLGYYKAMGGHAYARLSREDSALGVGPERVLRAVRPLPRVRRRAGRGLGDEPARHATSPCCALYERWVQTGSRRAAALLAERGHRPRAARRRPPAVSVVPACSSTCSAGWSRCTRWSRRRRSPTSCSPRRTRRGYPGGGSRTLVTQDGDDVSLGVVLEPGVGALPRRARPAGAARRRATSTPSAPPPRRSATSSTCSSARAPRAR